MKKHLFLTGPSGCGKTAVIRQTLGSAMAEAGGFVTERILSDEGSLLGFDLFPAAAAAGVEGFSGMRFLDYTSSPPGRDNEVFRVSAVRLLEEAEYYPYAMLDEVGGFELLIPQFRNALTELLNSDLPIIGVLKSQENAEQLRRRLGLGEKFSLYTSQLRRALDADSDTLVLDVRRRGDEQAVRAVSEWLGEYITGGRP